MTPTRLVFACPTYGPTDSQAVRAQRAAIMHAASSGQVQWVGDCSPERMGFASARNTVVQGVLHQEDVDGIFWCDSDIVLPVDAISRMASHRQDFVTGLYCQRPPPHWPLVAQFDPDRGVFHWIERWPANVLAPIDGCGFGCVLTSMRMHRALTPPWFTFEKFSEDFDFCLRAKRAGFQLWMDTTVLCGHLRDAQPATAEDFFRLRDSGELARYLPNRDSAA